MQLWYISFNVTVKIDFYSYVEYTCMMARFHIERSFAHITSLTAQLCIEGPLPSQESE